jgi:hypothetical protein
MGMPIRRWELVVDRQRVPSAVLGDEDTQPDYPVVLRFDGRVYNKEKRVAFRGTAASRGAFARLGGADVGLRLQTEANGSQNVWMISPDTRLYRQDEDDELPVLIPALTWQCLEWGREYRLYHVSEDPVSEELVFRSMLMWVERCRVPLAQLNRSLRRITGEASPP